MFGKLSSGDSAMLKRALILSTSLFVALQTFAGMKDIDREKLPQDAVVLATYQDVAELEPYVAVWSNEWRHPIPKPEVTARLEADLRNLQDATKNTPNNPELLLLLAQTAHYGYNVDIKDTFDLALDNFKAAQKLLPTDIRPQWWMSVHQCQTLQMVQGMTGLLAIEARFKPSELSTEFWDDYIQCATTSNMPAHVLRAASYLPDAAPSSTRRVLAETARTRFKPSSPIATYKKEEAWTVRTAGDVGPTFISNLCGLSFWSYPTWKLNLMDVQKGTCAAQLEVGPYHANGREVIPNYLVLARSPKPGESLADFLGALFSNPQDSSEEMVKAPYCPAQHCLARHAIRRGAYQKSGDGHGLAIAFESDMPQFPGLLFEVPNSPKPDNSKEQVQYFHPSEHLKRLDGKLYYFVLLDTASSVLDQANADFAKFLKALSVE